ncbi:MAG: Cyclase/dehydrase [Nitrospira sp.]|nr:MAG: Cyclase/dehydrase [Nitrospira sp.]
MAHMRGGIRTTPPGGRDRTEPNMSSGFRTEGGPHGYHEETYRNVGDKERLISGLIGGGLLLHSLRSPFSGLGALKALLGMALVQRSFTGHCAGYDMLGMNTRDQADTSSIGRSKVHTDRAIKIERSITIQRSAKDLYAFWRHLDNLPTIMSQVRSVEPLDDRRSHWVIDTLPGAPTVEWDAEIITEIENERIGWKTLNGATVEHAGSVRFTPLNDDRRTRVTITLQYEPPAGAIGAAIADLFGQEPGRKIARDLERFKQAMESHTTVNEQS